jgi:bifunctional non-homologous end joining protein LigD
LQTPVAQVAPVSVHASLQQTLPTQCLEAHCASIEQTSAFARAVAEALAGARPDLVVSRMAKSLRAGRVLIDWSQNAPSKTTVCAYSLRALERPTVAAPLRWEEVEAALRAGDAAALRIEAAAALERAEGLGDLFAPVEDLRQQLPALP